MSVDVNEILMKLERGDINSDEALREIKLDHRRDEVYNNHFLHIRVTGIDDDRTRVFIRIPLRMVKTGLNIGAVYAPELRDLDLHLIVEELHSFADGSILEVEDFEGDERVVLSIERMQD